jgi:hypothetical protein
MKNIRFVYSNESGQMIVLMGFILVISVLVIASFTASLSNVGINTPKIHSKALLPDFINLNTKFYQSLQSNFANKTNQQRGIEYCFNKSYDFFYKAETLKGRYFHATLNDWYEAGPVYIGYEYIGTFYQVGVTLTLYDGNTNITKDSVHTINTFET